MDETNRITDLASLRAEKKRLEVVARQQEEVLRNDFDYVAERYAPDAILNRMAVKMVPSFIRRSPLINTPINYIAKNWLDREEDIVSTHSDSGKGNKNRNIALGVLEGVGAYLLTKFVRNKMKGNDKEDHNGKEY